MRPGAPRWLRVWVALALTTAVLVAGARVLLHSPTAAPTGEIGTAVSDVRTYSAPTS